jgi:hypothetical protein
MFFCLKTPERSMFLKKKHQNGACFFFKTPERVQFLVGMGWDGMGWDGMGEDIHQVSKHLMKRRPRNP